MGKMYIVVDKYDLEKTGGAELYTKGLFHFVYLTIMYKNQINLKRLLSWEKWVEKGKH